MPASDAELIALLLATRDAGAFGELVRRHQGVVRDMLARMCGDRALADDLAQDAFVHAFERMDQFSGRGGFRSWVCRIAYTKLLQSARKRKWRARLMATFETEARELQSAAAPAEGGDRVDVGRALQHLSEAERAAVVLCYACGFSHSEAAEVMKAPVGTVKSHVARGRRKLEQLLSSHKRDAQ